MVRGPLVALALVGLGILCAACGSGAGTTTRSAAPKRPFLWQCSGIHLDQARDECYVRLLLADIDRSGDPATELPRIDRLATAAATDLEGRCHMLMHVVGRRWAAEHHLTLEKLQDVVPRSNDPGCSAGFGMGLVIYLGPQIIPTGGRSALATCRKLPTRYRQYTCVHSLGHGCAEAAVALAVRADRPRPGEGRVLRPPAPRGHRPFRQSGDRAPEDRRPRAVDAELALRPLPPAHAYGRASLGPGAPPDARRAAEG